MVGYTPDFALRLRAGGERRSAEREECNQRIAALHSIPDVHQ
jgi:hypothetical protein